MATNPYIVQGVQSEQTLFEDLIIESVQIYGQDVFYIPKTVIGMDDLMGEQSQAVFNTAIPIEMYIETFDGFGGEGNLFQKFGIEIRDQMKLVVAKRRWDLEIGADTFPRPFEGDLIYLPLSRSLFEIKFVEHEMPFYQLNNLPVHRIDLELFEYNGERFNTGVDDIDSFEILYGSGGFTLKLELISVGSSPIEFIPGETFINQNLGTELKFYSVEESSLYSLRSYDDFELLSSDAFILFEGNNTNILDISFGQVENMSSYSKDQMIIGQETGNTFKVVEVYDINNSEENEQFFPTDTEADNVTIERQAEEHIETTNNESNPFGFI